MEGYGTLYYPSGGLAYMGQWQDDKFNGKGTVFNETPVQLEESYDYTNFDQLGEYWVKYEGEFVDDNKVCTKENDNYLAITVAHQSQSLTLVSKRILAGVDQPFFAVPAHFAGTASSKSDIRAGLAFT